LIKTRKGDVRKLKIASRLRKETTMTREWIAKRLSAGVWRHLANRLRAMEKKKVYNVQD
jgi:hypothetical protein